MEITETGVNERIKQLYELSKNGASTALKAPVDAAAAVGEENALKGLGKVALNGSPVTPEERNKIQSDANAEAHSANLKSLQTKAGAALKTSIWEVFLEKLSAVWDIVSSMANGNIMDGLKALKNGGARTFSELSGVIKEWKVGSSENGFMETLERHEKLRNLEKLAAQDLGISDPEERKKVVAQLAGEAPLPTQVSGGASVNYDPKSPDSAGGKAGGKVASK